MRLFVLLVDKCKLCEKLSLPYYENKSTRFYMFASNDANAIELKLYWKHNSHFNSFQNEIHKLKLLQKLPKSALF